MPQLSRVGLCQGRRAMFRSRASSELKRLGPISAIAFLALAVLLPSLAPTGALAQGAVFQRSYIEPFPPGDRYRVLVVGDSLADGLWSGLYRAFQEDGNMEVINKSKPGSGFVRTDSYDWTKEIDDILKEQHRPGRRGDVRRQ